MIVPILTVGPTTVPETVGARPAQLDDAPRRVVGRACREDGGVGRRMRCLLLSFRLMISFGGRCWKNDGSPESIERPFAVGLAEDGVDDLIVGTARPGAAVGAVDGRPRCVNDPATALRGVADRADLALWTAMIIESTAETGLAPRADAREGDRPRIQGTAVLEAETLATANACSLLLGDAVDQGVQGELEALADNDMPSSEVLRS